MLTGFISTLFVAPSRICVILNLKGQKSLSQSCRIFIRVLRRLEKGIYKETCMNSFQTPGHKVRGNSNGNIDISKTAEKKETVSCINKNVMRRLANRTNFYQNAVIVYFNQEVIYV